MVFNGYQRLVFHFEKLFKRWQTKSCFEVEKLLILKDKCSKRYGIWKVVDERVEFSSKNFQFAYKATLFNHSSDATTVLLTCLFSKEDMNRTA